MNEEWDDQLKDKNSEKYKKISTVLTEQVQLTREVHYQIYFPQTGKTFSLGIPSYPFSLHASQATINAFGQN